jgi:hypothetical protein
MKLGQLLIGLFLGAFMGFGVTRYLAKPTSKLSIPSQKQLIVLPLLQSGLGPTVWTH